jgi:tetratricopeptide (TPR) repeat protein
VTHREKQPFLLRTLLFLWAALHLCACAHSLANRPTKGWNRYETPHFTLDTDLSPEDGAAAAKRLEHTRAALLSAAWPKALPPQDRAHAIVVADGLEVDRLFGKQVGSATLRGSEFLLVMRATPAASASVLQHELTHYLASFIYLRQPRWFSEGLAQFLETLQLSADGKTAELGAVNPTAHAQYKKNRAIWVRDALSWSQTSGALAEGDTQGLYGLSWAMVHFLYNTRQDLFARYQSALAKGERPRRAWDDVLGTSRAMDEEISHYLLAEKFPPLSVTIQNLDPTLQIRELTPSEVHVVRSELANAAVGFNPGSASDLKDESLAELDVVLKQEPQNVAALELKATRLQPSKLLPLARKAVQKHPEDPHAWYLLAIALRGMKDLGMEEQAALRKAASDRSFADAANLLAWQEMEGGQYKDALPLAARAVQLQPWSAPVVDTLAAVYDGLHRCPDAVTTERRAIDLLVDRVRPEVVAEYGQRLAKYLSECGAFAQSAAD